MIQATIEEREEVSSCLADESTIRRWRAGFASAEPDIKQRLAAVYARMVDKAVPIAESEDILGKIRYSEKHWLPFVIGLLINSGHKICTEFAFCPPLKSAKVDSATKFIAGRGQENVKTIKDTS